MKIPVQFNEVDIRILRDIAQQLNNVTEGRQSAMQGSLTAAPTTGSYSLGDVVRNSAPAEAGTAPNKYVVTGWVCTVGGTPGTWLTMKVPTGN